MKTAKAIPKIILVLLCLLFFTAASAWAAENDFLKGVFPQYDDNVVLNPEVADVVFGPTDETSSLLRTSLRLDYVPIFKGPWLFNAQYAFLGSFYEEKEIRDEYNSTINSFRASPGYNFGRFSLNLPVTYNHVMVADDGDNYDRQAYRMSLNIIHPIVDKLSLQLSGQFSLEPYDHIHSVFRAVFPGAVRSYPFRDQDRGAAARCVQDIREAVGPHLPGHGRIDLGVLQEHRSGAPVVVHEVRLEHRSVQL